MRNAASDENKIAPIINDVMILFFDTSARLLSSLRIICNFFFKTSKKAVHRPPFPFTYNFFL